MMPVDYQHIEKSEVIKDLIHVPFYNNDGEHYFTETLCIEYRDVDPREKIIEIEGCEMPMAFVKSIPHWKFDIREAIEMQTGKTILGEIHFVEKI